MKHFVLFCMLCLSLGTLAQTDVTNILNAQLPGEPGVLLLGCCNEDGLSPDGTNTDLCVWQDYVAYGDIELQRSGLVLRNCSLTIVDGNFITNGIEIEYTCGAELIFNGEGRVAMSWEELNQTLSPPDLPVNSIEWPSDQPYQLYDLQGKIILSGDNNAGSAVTKYLQNNRRSLYIIRIKGFRARII